MKHICKALVALNKYKGVNCDSIKDAEYTFEVEASGQLSVFNDGDFSLTSYHNGDQCDLEFNGWTFASIIYGGYHVPGSYACVHIKIECVDPHGAEVIVFARTEETSNFKTEGVALYMNKIITTCLFKDKNEFDSVKSLFKDYEDCQSDDVNKLNEIFEQLQKFKDVITRNESNDNIPTHFIKYAKQEYKKLVEYIKERVAIEKIPDALKD